MTDDKQSTPTAPEIPTIPETPTVSVQLPESVPKAVAEPPATFGEQIAMRGGLPKDLETRIDNLRRDQDL
jgi:hypothetical protein